MCGLVQKLTKDCADGKLGELWMKANIGNALLPKGRQGLLDDALAGDFTHALFIDDDMQFTLGAIDSLLSRDLDIVAVNGCKKKFPIEGSATGLDGKHMDSAGKTGVEEAAFAGMGIMLMKLDAIRSVQKPHFEIIWHEPAGTYLGEDYYFAAKLRGAGIKLHVDHDASRMTRHVGGFGYTFPALKKE